MMSNSDFLRAMEEEYSELTQAAPTRTTRKQLRQIIAKINKHHTETFLYNGVENAIGRAFRASSKKLRWSAADIEAHSLDLVTCVRHTAIEQRSIESAELGINVEKPLRNNARKAAARPEVNATKK